MSDNNFKNETHFNWITDNHFRNEITLRVSNSIDSQAETNKEVSETLGISLKKIWQIKNGTCTDFNAILNYINYFGQSFNFDKLPV